MFWVLEAPTRRRAGSAARIRRAARRGPPCPSRPHPLSTRVPAARDQTPSGPAGDSCRSTRAGIAVLFVLAVANARVPVLLPGAGRDALRLEHQAADRGRVPGRRLPRGRRWPPRSSSSSRGAGAPTQPLGRRARDAVRAACWARRTSTHAKFSCATRRRGAGWSSTRSRRSRRGADRRQRAAHGPAAGAGPGCALLRAISLVAARRAVRARPRCSLPRRAGPRTGRGR